MMQEEHGIIGKILAKYPVITDEEQQVLNDWLAKNGNRQKFDLIIDNEAREIDLNRFLRIRERKEANREKYHDAISNRSTIGSVVWWKKWPTYVAAASILFAVSLIGYKWFSGRNNEFEKEQPVVNQNQNKDVNPGQYKARLTLADGSVVVLDTFSNSKLVQQGSTTVLTRDGQLVYEKKGKDHEVLYNTLTTAKGETYGMVLSDGSKVWLNSQSSLRYPVAFTGDERRVKITGEAYFEVAPSISPEGGGKKQPFIAQVKGMEVKVLGTVFNVNAYDEENKITTTLLEGKVRLTKEDKTELLMPGQQAELLPSGSLQVNMDADLDKAVGWKDGLFVFKGDGVQYMMNQLARWYDVNVVYKGVIKDKFTGIINRNLPVSVVLEMLEKSTVHFQIEGRTIIVTP